ncbi:MAG: hypothetical protein RID23_06540 [Roseovarius sp.]
MSRKKHTVLGHHAPAPRPTLLALTLLSAGLSLVFLLGLGLYRLCVN